MRNSSPRLCALKRAGRRQTPCARSNGRAMPGRCRTRTSCWKITANCAASRVFCAAGVTKVKQFCRTIPRRIIAFPCAAVLPCRRNLERRWRNGESPFARFTTRYSSFPPLPVDFVEKNRRRRAHIERIHRGRHGNGHRFIASFQDRRGNAVALAAEDDAAIAGEIGAGDGFVLEFKL